MKKLILLCVLLISVLIISCSRDEPTVTGPVTPPIVTGSVIINEIYSSGSPDWVELYNKGNASIDISGYKMYDPDGNTGAKEKFVIPAGTVIPAGGFLTLDCDGTGIGMNPNFKFSADGEEVWIENTSGLIVDHITFPAFGADTSYGRKPDGSSNLQLLTTVTKGTTNNPGVVNLQPIVINEVFSTGSPDWIELFNPNNQIVDISGYTTYDPSTVTDKYVIPAGTTIPANGFLVLSCDDSSKGLHTNYKLSSSGEDVNIEDASGNLIDSVVFPALVPGTSYGRLPDGSTNWQILTTPTKGTANQ
ncbi:MAG: lamin tail domain-containing protein [bacterium]